MSLAHKLGAIFASSGLIDPAIGGTPAGAVLAFAGATAPSGWLLCYGQAVSRTTYSALFTAIGTAHGTGDGSTTFNLPDMRGRVAAGKDDMGGSAASRLTTGGGGVNGVALGAVGGLETHTLTTAQLAAHTHTFDKYSGSSAGSSPSTGGGVMADFSTTASSSTGSGSAHNNTQPTIVLNHIIKV